MNHEAKVKRGGLIKPSARKSIHNHHCCPFSQSEHVMGRYGLNKPYKNKESGEPSHDEGRDEVDNVMSKFAIPISNAYQYSEKRKQRRRSSVDNELSNHFNQENVSDVLSKSMPTVLPSHSYYSDDSDTSDEGEKSYQSQSTAYHSSQSDRSQNEESFQHLLPQREASVFADGIRRRHHNQVLEKNRSQPIQSGTPIWPILLLVTALVLSVIAFQNFAITANVVHNYIYDKHNFYSDMMNLAEKYNVKPESIEQVQIGISTILENEDADSFVFVYNSKSSSFNAEEFNDFMNDIAYLAAKYLRNESISVRHTVIEGARLGMHDSEELIERYRDDVKRTGVMLVKGIESVPSVLAMAFHYYCDEYNPIAKKSAVFSTFDLANCSHGKTSSHATLEKCLKNKWKGVPSDNMGPLLTRVVSVVVDVTDAF